VAVAVAGGRWPNSDPDAGAGPGSGSGSAQLLVAQGADLGCQHGIVF
jgi:hypothetical protein